MIFVKVIGGLGNQLFQYAFAKGLAKKLNCSFKLDVTAFSRYYSLHRFALSDFTFRYDLLSPADARRFHRATGPGITLVALLQRLKPSSLRCFFRETKAFQFDEMLISPRKFPCYFDGYWQNEGYFHSVANEIRAEFCLKVGLSDDDRRYETAIRSRTGVSVHIRRGDYVTDPKTRRFLGVCPTEYFYNALELIQQQVSGVHLFVFSDDPEWVRSHFSPGAPMTIVSDRPNARGCVDLYLMSLCRHHVIANSTFSWWGAWLNPQPDKIVVAPKAWAQGALNTSREILPAGWYSI